MRESRPAGPDAFAALVEGTRGGQPWRRLLHALTGLTIVIVLVGRAPSRLQAAAVSIGITTVLLGLDLARLRVPALNLLFFRTFHRLVSPREARGLASSTWYMAGVAAAILLFPRPAAISGILVLALADPAASWIGRRWGRRTFLGGSVEGSAAFLVVAGTVLAVRHAIGAAVLAAVFAAIVERGSWPLDDNLTLPVATAAALAVLGG